MFFLKLSLATALLTPFSVLASISGNDNIALYWGQNSAGGANTQQRLSYYCSQSASDIVLISFLTQFSGDGSLPVLNVANACEGTYFAGTQLLQCDTIAEDIQTCQSLGKKVLLSMGGASGAYGISSSAHAVSLADQLWDIFGGGSSSTRPFGTSVLDGFDLDIEGGSSTYYPDFVTAMRKNYATDTSKSYYISAAPQCPIPDYYVGDAITKSDIDFIFVQFYNNYCGMQALGSENFNFAAWDSLVKQSSFNKQAKVYLGVPGATSAAGSGYVDVNTVIKTALSLQKTYSTFGGVMIWDASQAWANNDFGNTIKKALVSGSNVNSVSSSSPAVGSSTASVVPQSSSSSGVVTTTSATVVTSSTPSLVVTDTANKDVDSQTIQSVSSVVSSLPVEITVTSSSVVPTSTKASSELTVHSTGTVTTSSPILVSSSDVITVTVSSSSEGSLTLQDTATATTGADSSSSSSSSGSTPSASGDGNTGSIHNGDPCNVNGEMTCVGTQFATCNNNKWVVRSCAPGTVCYSTADALYCVRPGTF